ncbi:uncharacterized protein YjcR [Luteibacter sp. 1214]|uniref:terminase large subunit domain-containing protein n=1 Tax=Luteibacter sp. 1214 TaxID=2817735 RepID=UPI00285B432B|nr:terminase family protein [Luteibacter sp. 1214]MDR6642755.1 uncharacterized protein YjcR [Luteibacter sp. 1214]
MLPTVPDIDPRRLARHLFFAGHGVTAIADRLGEPRSTVESWKQREGWASATPLQRTEDCLDARLCMLILKEDKSPHDFKEIDLLGRQMERLARVRRYEAPGGHEGDLNPAVANRNKDPKRKAEPNAFTPEQIAKLREAFFEASYDYQRHWYEAGQNERTRIILKSRQIGATYYFAREALIDALETGRNQIFLSASRSQANVFRGYQQDFVREVLDMNLAGGRDRPIKLGNGAELYYLGTNSRTAQGYHGNLYFDEFFWVHSFEQLEKLASGMAMHKKWRETYFSTPSALSHDAYPFWSGAQYNASRAKADRIDIDVSHRALSKGMRCADGMYRQIVTIEDAVAGGCDLFDLDQLRRRYSDEKFRQLLMCEFIDDAAAAFTFALIKRCMVDTWDVWDDVRFEAPRIIGDAPVGIGFDPSKGTAGGDPSGCTVTALPTPGDDRFRVLEKFQWAGQDFDAQATSIKALTERYNVADIAIDTTGMGIGVYQLVRQFFPAARAIQYSPEVKARMVMKATDVMNKGRLEWDAGWTDLAAAFMAIRKTMTASGRHVTFEAGRSEAVGHADLAWAVMHTLIHEPLEGRSASNQSFMEIYD